MLRGGSPRKELFADQEPAHVLTDDDKYFADPVGAGGCCATATLVGGSQWLVSLKRYTGRTRKFGNFVSIESLACGCCGETLFDQWLIRLGLANVMLVRAFPRPPDSAR